jgi:hypothetical protein
MNLTSNEIFSLAILGILTTDVYAENLFTGYDENRKIGRPNNKIRHYVCSSFPMWEVLITHEITLVRKDEFQYEILTELMIPRSVNSPPSKGINPVIGIKT